VPLHVPAIRHTVRRNIPLQGLKSSKTVGWCPGRSCVVVAVASGCHPPACSCEAPAPLEFAVVVPTCVERRTPSRSCCGRRPGQRQRIVVGNMVADHSAVVGERSHGRDARAVVGAAMSTTAAADAAPVLPAASIALAESCGYRSSGHRRHSSTPRCRSPWPFRSGWCRRTLHRAVRLGGTRQFAAARAARFAAPLALLTRCDVGALGAWCRLRCSVVDAVWSGPRHRHRRREVMAAIGQRRGGVAPSPAAVGRRRPIWVAPSNTFTVPFAAAAPSGSRAVVGDVIANYPAILRMKRLWAQCGVEAGGLSTSDHLARLFRPGIRRCRTS